MLATRAERVPTSPDWLHEVKWDGIRLLADSVPDRGLRLTSRNENDVTAGYLELSRLGAGRDLLVDGEVVAFRDGLPSFAALADRMHVRDPRRVAALAELNPVTLLIFDVLRLDGRDLTGLPLAQRREVLEGLELLDERWQVPAAYDDGQVLLRATEEQGLEGVISKRRSSRYEPGSRSRNWLKFPHRQRRSWVVGGWRPETGSQSRLGALLVGRPSISGEPSGASLVFMGRVGSGITGKSAATLLHLLTPLARDTSPFGEVSKADTLGTNWVEPRLVIDVESLGLAGSGRLRQPAFVGIRSDLGPGDVGEQS